MQRLIKSKYFLMLAGVTVGVTNGLLGAGGGIIAVWALRAALKDAIEDERDVLANALCITLPISALSCLSYALHGSLKINGIGLYVIPAILGGALGGVLLGRIKATSAGRLFATLVVVSGVLLIIR